MEHMSALTSRDFMESTDPFELFSTWIAEAGKTEPSDPNAMALATADTNGMPDVRIVLLKDFDRRGFTFFTNLESAKGRELAANPQAALDFHWKTLERQVRVRGPVEPVTAQEADAYFATRPRGSRIGAWASQQSRELQSREIFEAEIAEYEARFPGEPPRPPHWSGFRVVPLRIEFWHNRLYRLHDRLVFHRLAPTDTFSRLRLYP
jgi:pyridoxamine 5'-phosphate oxidase